MRHCEMGRGTFVKVCGSYDFTMLYMCETENSLLNWPRSIVLNLVKYIKSKPINFWKKLIF